MRIEGLKSSGANIASRGVPQVGGGASTDGADATKTIGETPPVVLSLSEIGELASLFAPSGLVGRLKKRLNHLKQKNCDVVPADGTVACVDDNDVVYLGVGFLKQCIKRKEKRGDKEGKKKDEEEENLGIETLAGVLAHEWGHACALKPDKEALQKMNWNQIFETRREHETLADEISGRLLFLMGYSPKGLVNFLTTAEKDTHNLKYHNPKVRAQIIQQGFDAEKRKAQLSRQLFKNTASDDPYKSTLLDIA